MLLGNWRHLHVLTNCPGLKYLWFVSTLPIPDTHTHAHTHTRTRTHAHTRITQLYVTYQFYSWTCWCFQAPRSGCKPAVNAGLLEWGSLIWISLLSMICGMLKFLWFVTCWQVMFFFTLCHNSTFYGCHCALYLGQITTEKHTYAHTHAHIYWLMEDHPHTLLKPPVLICTRHGPRVLYRFNCYFVMGQQH